MPNLKTIQLESDQIESIERNTFKNLKYLQTLSLQDNKLNQIYDFYFEKLFNLNELDLSDNSIEIIEKNSFNDLKRLTKLNLNRNKKKE